MPGKILRILFCLVFIFILENCTHEYYIYIISAPPSHLPVLPIPFLSFTVDCYCSLYVDTYLLSGTSVYMCLGLTTWD